MQGLKQDYMVNGNATWTPALLGEETGEKGKPTIDGVMDLLKTYKDYYSAFHAQCVAEEEYYLLRRPVPAPEGHDAIRPATATAIVNVATDHVDVEHIDIDVPLASPRAKARAERLEKFYQGAWAQTRQPLLRVAAKHAFLYGVGFIKSMWNADKWPNAPILDDFASDEEYKTALSDFMDKRGIAFPFDDSVINPRNLVWDDSRTGIGWFIEFYERQTRDIRHRYPEWLSVRGDKEPTAWIEYWDREWVGYIADMEWVWGPHRHGYGFVPLTMATPASSIDADNGPPQDRYRGILQPVHDLLDEEARLVTAYSAILSQYAWRTIDVYGPQAMAKQVADDYKLFGAINVIPPGVEVKESPKVPPPQELLAQLSVVQTMIEEATFPNVIRGIRPKGVAGGFMVSVLAGMGRLVFGGVASSMSHAVEQINSKRAMLVENKAGDAVTVHARTDVHNFDQTIGPEDIRGYYENIVHLTAEAPEESERVSLLAMRLYQAGMISLYEAQKRAGITNPLEEQMQMSAETLLRSEPFVQAQVQIAMERMGLLNQLAQAVGETGVEQPGTNTGNMFLPGQAQLPVLGERNRQQGRVASNQGRPSVYPQGADGLGILGRQLGTAGGGAVSMPNGRTVR